MKRLLSGNNCKQSIIPKVDETEPPCRMYTRDKCVIISDAEPFIGNLTNENLDTYLKRLVIKLKKQEALINGMYQRIKELEKKI